MATDFSRAGLIKLQEYAGFGGKTFDSRHISNLWNLDRPHHFGVMMSKLYSASDRYNNKPFTFMTEGSKNVAYIDGSLLQWTVIGNDDLRVRVSEFLEAGNTRIGFMNQTFRVAFDEPWFREPDVLMGESNQVLYEVVGEPVPRGSYFEYTLRIQGQDPNMFVEPAQLQVGVTFTKVSTTVATEMNQKYGSVSAGSQFDLRSQFGAFANEFQVSDGVIIAELRKKRNGSTDKAMYTGGYVFPIYQDGKPVGSLFTTYMEARIKNETLMNREVMMQFGKISTTTDPTGRYIKRTGPGWREIVKDGHELYHNGSLTAKQLEDFLMSIFLNRNDETNRNVVISTGTLGARMFDQMLADEASSFLTVDSHYIRDIAGAANSGMLEYGYQFKKLVAKNGITVTLAMDPFKDDPRYCPERHPANPIYTVDSARMDIYNFSDVGSSSPDGSNMFMVKENDQDEYYWISGAIDPRTGRATDGRMVPSASKMTSCRYATNGGLVVWDPSRVGSIIYRPDY